LKELFHLVFVCIGNRNRSPFAEFFFPKLISEKDKSLINKIRVTSAGFITRKMKNKMVELNISLPEPLFGRPIAESTRAFLLSHNIIVPDEWRTSGLTPEVVDEADMIIAVLPDQKKDIAELYPENEFKLFTIREVSRWDGYLVQEDYGFKDIPEDNTLWNYVEENTDYVSSILSEMERMLVKAYPHILEHLGLKSMDRRNLMADSTM
jgi:protein-tyrosine-phosphatase